MIYPENFEDKIGFSKIRAMLKELCLSELGTLKVDNIRFVKSFDLLKRLLGQVAEFKAILAMEEEFPVSFYFNIIPSLKKNAIEGSFLEREEMFDLKRSMEAIASVLKFIRKLDDTEFTYMQSLSSDVKLPAFVLDKINSILNKQGEIRDNASTDLRHVRQELAQKQHSVSKRMHSILKEARQDGLVEQDAELTIRDGRLVIPIPSGNKRKLKGFVHDESATGKTSFIEPAEIFEVNNEIRELFLAEQREIIKILRNASDYIRPYVDELQIAYRFLGIIDFIRAKALLARKLDAGMPLFEKTRSFDWKKARHPLLYLNYKSLGKNVVPLNISLNDEERLLVISGPNAGGKSVCLKTTGLIQYMFQCGMLVPLDQSSSMGMFNNIFIDIGDEQSIENDLSTYSSHLVNMKYFLKHADNSSLILIDEFGTGTEPLLGGSVAESILASFNRQQAYGVVTTHYTNLKHFATISDGIVNGAMLYDQQKLEPLFQLSIGKPGSSFAFEIARKIGLPDEIINHAKDMVGRDHVDYDRMLKDVSRDKKYWENKRKSVKHSEKELTQLVDSYAAALDGAEKERKRIIAEAKAEAKNLLSGTNKIIENTIRKIKESQAEKERTREVRNELNQYRQEIESDPAHSDGQTGSTLSQLKDKESKIRKKLPKTVKLAKPEQIRQNIKQTFRIGDKVKMLEQDVAGEIVEMNDKYFVVAFGNLLTSIEKQKLQRISAEEHNRLTKGLGNSVSRVGWNMHEKRLNFKHSVDIRGMRVDDALPLVSNYIDDAITFNMNEVKILHGTGNGILRQVIREYLMTVDLVKWCGDEHVEFGGAGITVVKFKNE